MADGIPSGFQYTTEPITSTTPGQVIQNLVIDVSGDQPAINVTSDNVTIKNVLIRTGAGDGIDVSGDNASISNVEVDGPTPVDNGGMDGDGSTGIYSYAVSGLKVDHATFRNTGTGIATNQSPGTTLSNIEGYNMQGPFPGGQLVQFGSSNGSSLTNFYVHNDPNLSHPEDDISVIDSPDTTISRGVVDGDNSPSGVGVMVEGTSNGTRVSDVDAIHMGDGAFSAYSNDVTFDRVRSFSNSAGDQGRGRPLSNGLIFYAEGSNVSFDDATYTDPGDPDNVSNGNGIAGDDISQAAGAVPTGHITNTFAWSGGDSGSSSPSPASPGVQSPQAPDQALSSTLNDVFDAAGQGSTTFVFNPGYGQDTVRNFEVAGQDHDVLDLPSSDFSSIAAVLRDTHTVNGNAVITDPTSRDTITLTGVTRSELRANKQDITFHS